MSTFNAVTPLIFDYFNQVEDMESFSMFDFVDDMHESYNPIEDEWHSYYETEHYDDESWSSNLEGINAQDF